MSGITEGGAVPRATESWPKGKVMSAEVFRLTKPGHVGPSGVSRDVLVERVADYAATIEAMQGALRAGNDFAPGSLPLRELRAKGWLK